MRSQQWLLFLLHEVKGRQAQRGDTMKGSGGGGLGMEQRVVKDLPACRRGGVQLGDLYHTACAKAQ